MAFIHKLTRIGWIAGLDFQRSFIRTLRPTLSPIQSRSSFAMFGTKSSEQGGKSDETSQAKESFNEFRAREERKEQEFEAQSKAEEPKQSEQNEESKDEGRLSAIEIQILEAALGFVNELNWSKQALAKGAETVGVASTAQGMFERGGAELIDYFNHKCNQQLIEYMEKLIAESKEPEPPPKFVARAIEYRLRLLAPYKTQWPQALAIMTLPPNVPTALSSLLTMVDDICYYAGDRSVDFNWYTRRIGLASIYKATELFMLQDSSPDYQRTWKFLEHRISDATKVQDLISQSGGMSQHIQEAGKSIFDTARNILGLNFNRR